MSTRIVNLEYDGDPPDTYCIACGAPIYVKGESSRCEHIAFTYIQDIGEFDLVAPHLKDKINAIAEEAEGSGASCEEMLESILTEINSQSVICYSITTNGVGCGPVSSTVVVAIDFNPPQITGS